MNKYQVFTDKEEFVVEADGWYSETGYTVFYSVRSQLLRGEREMKSGIWPFRKVTTVWEDKAVERRAGFHWVRTADIRRVLAQGIAARSDTTGTGVAVAVGKSPVGQQADAP